MKLPPMPEPFDNDRYFAGPELRRFDLFIADQLRAYGEACARAALEAAYEAMFRINGDKVTRFDAQTAIRELEIER